MLELCWVYVGIKQTPQQLPLLSLFLSLVGWFDGHKLLISLFLSPRGQGHRLEPPSLTGWLSASVKVMSPARAGMLTLPERCVEAGQSGIETCPGHIRLCFKVEGTLPGFVKPINFEEKRPAPLIVQ